MSTNLDDVLAKAQAASQAIAPLGNPGAGLPAMGAVGAGSGGIAVYNMTQDSFLTPSGMECDAYVQVKDAGIKLNKDWQGYIDEFEAIIDLQEVAFFMGIRKEVGSNVTYAKTYDGMNTTRGEPFAVIVEQFKRDSQKNADPYKGADIPMVLTATVADPKNKGTTMEDGKVVGLSTSITGFRPWQSFHRKIVTAGFGNARVKVKVTHEPRQNSSGQDYGVCKFELIEVLAD